MGKYCFLTDILETDSLVRGFNDRSSREKFTVDQIYILLLCGKNMVKFS